QRAVVARLEPRWEPARAPPLHAAAGPAPAAPPGAAAAPVLLRPPDPRLGGQGPRLVPPRREGDDSRGLDQSSHPLLRAAAGRGCHRGGGPAGPPDAGRHVPAPAQRPPRAALVRAAGPPGRGALGAAGGHGDRGRPLRRPAARGRVVLAGGPCAGPPAPAAPPAPGCFGGPRLGRGPGP